MGGESVAESWFGSMKWIPWKGVSETDKGVIDILAFEVAGLMYKVVNLWQCVSDGEIQRLRKEVVNSIGLKMLVSEDDDYLMELALNEIVENFVFLARSVARLGKRCKDPVYHRFEHFVNEPIQNGFQWVGWIYRLKKMERKMKKMERFVASMTQLSQEQEVLAELEQSLRRMQKTEFSRVKVLEFQKKVILQRQEVRNLREMSPWNRSYDYVVRLLVRSLFTILERMKHGFGTYQLPSVEREIDSQLMNIEYYPRSRSFTGLPQSSVHPSESNPNGFYSGSVLPASIQGNGDNTRRKDKQRPDPHMSSNIHGNHLKTETNQFAHVGHFKGWCTNTGTQSPVVLSCKPTGSSSMRLTGTRMKNIARTSNTNMKSFSCRDRIYYQMLLVNSKRRLLTAPPSTLGDAGLALHYARLILLIEDLASSPHLIDLHKRDVLYSMLPTTIRTALRIRLKSYAGVMTSNTDLLEEWSQVLRQILDWLAPLAQNMVKWHSERNFEKQDAVSGTMVLLVQTLHFASQAKTEAAIIDLLVGLNYVSRIGRQPHERYLQDPTDSRVRNDGIFKRVDISYDLL